MLAKAFFCSIHPEDSVLGSVKRPIKALINPNRASSWNIEETVTEGGLLQEFKRIIFLILEYFHELF